MTPHWERVRFQVRCAYGCGDIKHSDWVYIPKGGWYVCESCAAGMDIRRPAFGPQETSSEPHGLVPASRPRRDLTAVGAIAESLQEPQSFAGFLAKLRRIVGTK